MGKFKKYIILFIPFFLLGFLCGCASFRSGQLAPISHWPPQATMPKKSISIIVTTEGSLNGKEQEVNAEFTKIWRKQIIKAYRESGLFSEVKTGFAETDFQAEVRIIDNEKGSSALSMLSGLTFTLIPWSCSDTFTLKTTIRDREGKTLGVFEDLETITLRYQLFLIFLTPFNFPYSVNTQTMYDLTRATIIDAHAKNCF